MDGAQPSSSDAADAGRDAWLGAGVTSSSLLSISTISSLGGRGRRGLWLAWGADWRLRLSGRGSGAAGSSSEDEEEMVTMSDARLSWTCGARCKAAPRAAGGASGGARVARDGGAGAAAPPSWPSGGGDGDGMGGGGGGGGGGTLEGGQRGQGVCPGEDKSPTSRGHEVS